MKPAVFVLTLLAALIVTSGCTRTVAKSSDPEPTPAAVFKEGRGLQFTPAAAELVGLQTGEVATRDFPTAKGAASVPAAALLRTVKGDFVYVVNGGWYLRTPVTVGASDGAWHEIRDGLYEGDRIVTHGTRVLWLAELQAVNGGVGCADDK